MRNRRMWVDKVERVMSSVHWRIEKLLHSLEDVTTSANIHCTNITHSAHALISGAPPPTPVPGLIRVGRPRRRTWGRGRPRSPSPRGPRATPRRVRSPHATADLRASTGAFLRPRDINEDKEREIWYKRNTECSITLWALVELTFMLAFAYPSNSA